MKKSEYTPYIKGSSKKSDYVPAKIVPKDSPLVPATIVPKNSPLTPWKPKPRNDGYTNYVVPKDSPLIPYGKDGKPLGSYDQKEKVQNDSEIAVAALKKDLASSVFYTMGKDEKGEEIAICQTYISDPDAFDSICNQIDRGEFKKDLYSALGCDAEVCKNFISKSRSVFPSEDQFISYASSIYKNVITSNNSNISEAKSSNKELSKFNFKEILDLEKSDPFYSSVSKTISTTQSVGIPSFYHGFNNTTYIDIWISSGSGLRGRVTIGRENIVKRVIHKNFSIGRTRIKFGELVSNDTKIRNIVLNGTHHQWRGIKLPDDLDYVEIKMDEGSEAKIGQVKYYMNRVEGEDYPTFVLNTEINKFIKTENGSSIVLALRNYIEDYRQDRARWQFFTNNGIIRAAAGDYGKSWSNKYPAYWRKTCERRKGWHGLHCDWHLDSWCTEFATWAIRQGSSLSPEHLYFAAEAGIWFDDNGKWISPGNNIAYESLGELVRKGFYCSINSTDSLHNDSHSTLFLDWVEPFNANLHTNWFWGLGGNQGGGKVCYKKFYVTKNDPDENPDLELFDRWSGLVWVRNLGRWYTIDGRPYQAEDGFGDTS